MPRSERARRSAPPPPRALLPELERFIARSAALVDRALEQLLPVSSTAPRRLHSAMRYAVFSGGKRIRPALTLLAFAAARPRGSASQVLRAACAVELVHCFSLVHDDLPCLDDSPTRRGRPTVHCLFDEATALLAGDALLALAFEILSEPQTGKWSGNGPAIALELARAAGASGMIGGQAAELELPGRKGRPPTLAALESVHRRKTGRLFEAAAVAGGLAGGAKPPLLVALRRYARQVGLAFQIADDLLDCEGDAVAAGMGTVETGHNTYPGLLGAKGARLALARARSAARREAKQLGTEVSGVAMDLADFAADRRS